MSVSILKNPLFFYGRRFVSSFHVPRFSVWKEISPKSSDANGVVSVELVNKLERLALVNFGSQEGVRILEAAVRLADEMKSVPLQNERCIYVQDLDRSGVYSNLVLADDVAVQNEPRVEIMSNAVKSVENYFVSPIGNIALQQEENKYGLSKKEESDSNAKK